MNIEVEQRFLTEIYSQVHFLYNFFASIANNNGKRILFSGCPFGRLCVCPFDPSAVR